MQNISLIGWLVIAFVAILLFIVLMTKGAKLMFNNKTVEVSGNDGEKLNLDLLGLMYVMADDCRAIEQRKNDKLDDIIPNISFHLSSLSNLACLNLRVESVLNARRRRNGFDKLLTKEKVDAYINCLFKEIQIKVEAEKKNTLICTSHPIDDVKDEKIMNIAELFTIKALLVYIQEFTDKVDLYKRFLPLYKSMNDKNRVEFCESKIKKHTSRVESLTEVVKSYKEKMIW